MTQRAARPAPFPSGGSNIRAGVVALGTKPKRDEAVERLVRMLTTLMKRAQKAGLNLAPFLGIGCPGVIEADGSISRGGQNLPGNWESSRFNLPALLSENIPKISGHHTHVVMHNDAVVHESVAGVTV